MKVGATNTYINARLAGLLDSHGPQGDMARPLSAKLNYILPAWDSVLREERARWHRRLGGSNRLEWLRREIGKNKDFANLGTVEEGLAAILKTIEASVARGDNFSIGFAEEIQRTPSAAKAALVWMMQQP